MSKLLDSLIPPLPSSLLAFLDLSPCLPGGFGHSRGAALSEILKYFASGFCDQTSLPRLHAERCYPSDRVVHGCLSDSSSFQAADNGWLAGLGGSTVGFNIG